AAQLACGQLANLSMSASLTTRQVAGILVGDASLAASRDGSLVLVPARDVAKLYRMPGATLAAELPAGPANVAALSPDGKRALIGGYPANVQLWDVTKKALIAKLPG